jgi:outer membrane protein TolC
MIATLRRTILPALIAVTVSAAPGASQLPADAVSPLAPPCLEGEPVSLARVWSETRTGEPGYRAVEEAIAAEEALRSAILRERAPGVALEGLENWGQRLSPSEERNLGVGPRGELRVAGTWTLLDADRSPRAREASLRRSEAVLAGEAFDLAFRADVGRLYVETAIAGALAEGVREQRIALEALAGPVQRRLEEGVDARWESHLLDEALARAERRLAEAETHEAATVQELSVLMGRCVRATDVSPRPHPAPEVARDLAASPEVLRLRRLADTREAAAGIEAGRGRFQLDLVGSTGPTRSRAFVDESFRMEYLLGLAGRWSPDLSGVRRHRAESEAARARGLRAEADSRQVSLERELARIRTELAHAGERALRLDEEAARTERRLEVALLRWGEGVGHWTDVIQALEAAHETRRLRLELDREAAFALIREAEARGALNELPALLGQEEELR